MRAPSPVRDRRRDYCSRRCKVRAFKRDHPDRWDEYESRRKSRVYVQSPERQARVAAQREERARVATAKHEQVRVEAQRRHEARRFQQSDSTSRRICKICGSQFLKPLYHPGMWKLCSEACRQIAHQANRKKARRIRRESGGDKPAQRARKKGLPYERCGPIAVCERDKWRCQLCGVATPRRLRGLNRPTSPEIDHIIPLASPLSPGHVWSNVQCLCRRCNIQKGATWRGQLRLVM